MRRRLLMRSSGDGLEKSKGKMADDLEHGVIEFRLNLKKIDRDGVRRTLEITRPNGDGSLMFVTEGSARTLSAISGKKESFFAVGFIEGIFRSLQLGVLFRKANVKFMPG